jgi:hypothetical protein
MTEEQARSHAETLAIGMGHHVLCRTQRRGPGPASTTANGRLRNPCHDRPAQQRAGADPRVNTGEDSLVQRPRPAGGALVATSPRPDYSCLRKGIGKYDSG